MRSKQQQQQISEPLPKATASSAPSSAPSPTPPSSWTFGAADALIGSALLAMCLGISIPTAVNLNRQARALDESAMASRTRSRALASTARYTEGRRKAIARFRTEANRYIESVESRPRTAWTTLVSELSDRRPEGVWIRRLSGDGPRFRVEVGASRPELISAYAAGLQQSPAVDFAACPPPSIGAAQVFGRATGE